MSDCKTDNSSSYLFIATLPLWIFVMFMVLDDDKDEYALLTEEQKLEKQKELELQKQERIIENQKNLKWWSDGLNHLVEEKPFPFVALIGLVLVMAIMKSANSRHYSDFTFFRNKYLEWINPTSIFGIFVFFVFIAWVTGLFDPLIILRGN